MKNKVDRKTGHTIVDKKVPVKIRLFFFFSACFLSYFLYKYCLFNVNSNPVVTTYFCIISLSCLLIAGLPVDKFTL